jgi:trk system potassium uptake protein TrkA
MNIVICGAGEVGQHAARVFGADGHDVTIIDLSARKLAAVEEAIDIRTLCGNGAQVEVLREANVHGADLFFAATNIDEINLLTAGVAKGVGVARSVARVHHSAYFDERGFDYGRHLGIDHLVCPEHATAVAIAQTLRNPGALAVESFARGRVEMQQFQVSDKARAIGTQLADIQLPAGARLAAIERNGRAFLPTRDSVIASGDIVTLVGDVETFEHAQKLFVSGTARRQHVVIMGGTALGVWLARALHSRQFAVKMFVSDRQRAEELAAKLEWVTMIHTDPDNPALFEEENVQNADAFVALAEDDEHNILWAARAKSLGVKSAIAVLQRATYLHLLHHVGIDRAFSPRATAVAQMRQWIEDVPLRRLASLAEGTADVYEVRVSNGSDVVGKPLREIAFPESLIIAAIERGEKTFVPGAADAIQSGDRLVVAGPAGIEKTLKKVFGIQ